MIALARSAGAKKWAQRSQTGNALAQRFIAGASLEEAVVAAKQLLDKSHLHASLYYLGEYVEEPQAVAANVQAKIAAVRALALSGLNVHISVDPTQIGYLRGADVVRRNAFAIAEEIARVTHRRCGGHALMLDMEDHCVTDATLALHDELRDAGLPVGITLQAYLRRSEEDLRARLEEGVMIRIVKGAFAERPAIAYNTGHEIKENFRRLIQLSFKAGARSVGFRPVIATHDEALQKFAAERAEAHGWKRGVEYEFEMLLGVRRKLAELQASRGEFVRLYSPFGRDWWPYVMRRIGERPANLWLLGRSFLG